jgi:hypothetical protein
MGILGMREGTTKARVAGGVLALLWAAAIGGLVASAVAGEHATGPGFLLGVAYLAALVVYLAWTGRPLSSLPDLDATGLPKVGFWGTVAGILGVTGLFFALGLALHPGATLIVVSALMAVGIVAAWRDAVSARLAGVGLMAGLVCGLGTAFLGPGDLPTALLYGLTVPPLFVGGGLLLEQNWLSHIRVIEGRTGQGLRSFVWGCVAAVPPALLNLLGGAGSGDTAIDRWWEPFFAVVPGIAEETWARLFLTALLYGLLRPRSNERPRRAVVAAILLGATIHSLAHFPALNLPSVVMAALVYGVPMGVLFVQRDLERAVGYHVFIDFVRFLGALLG